MLPISFIALFLDSSFISPFTGSTTSALLACSGWSFWDTKSYCVFVPAIASRKDWRKSFLVKVCKPLSPKDLLKEAPFVSSM
ncbi:hypothetical protein BDF21DRAFT_405669 [Thamnidium elegans]|nr:hypothetical protein BDF21DRAFT_405669 [Thamnidium elegans]